MTGRVADTAAKNLEQYQNYRMAIFVKVLTYYRQTNQSQQVETVGFGIFPNP